MNQFVKFVIFGFFIIVLLIATHYIGWLKPVENLAVRIVAPVQGGVYSLSLNSKSFYNAWLTKRNLLAENETLKNQLKAGQINQAELNSLAQENELLKKELKFVQESGLKFVAAKIITGVSDNLSKSVIINRGQSDGLQKGMAVVADNGILVGKISEVYDNFSKVLLLIDDKSKVAAAIQNQTETIGLVEGQLGLSLIMTNIPQDQEIKLGDLVVTSGLEGPIPKNLLIARVASLSASPSEIFKTAILSPIIPFDNLSYVEAIVP